MKKATIASTSFFICFFICFLVSAGLVFGQDRPRPRDLPAGISPQQTVPGVSKKPEVPEGIQKIGRAEINNLEVGTDAAGKWFWKATVKNTGATTLEGKNLTVQGYSIAFPPQLNEWKPASGSIVGNTSIAPGRTATVTRFWTRCCLTDELKVELRDTLSKTVWDTKTLTNLIHRVVDRRVLDVRVKRIEWNDNAKTWRATVKNFTNYTVKIFVQGYLWPAGANTPVAAGGSQVTLGPQAEQTVIPLHAATAKNGDTLKVHFWFDMNAETCGESRDDCGAKGSHIIMIPNSRDF